MIDYKTLEKEAPPGAFSLYDMEVLVPEVERLEPGDCYLEIGVDKGRSLWVARQFAKEGVRVCGIDLQIDPKILNTIFTQGDSIQIADSIIGKIDMLLIDGDHTYGGCKRDIDVYYPKMKKGGVMLFHDCDETSPGVIHAVAEFADIHRLEINHFELLKRTDKNTSMAIIKLKS